MSAKMVSNSNQSIMMEQKYQQNFIVLKKIGEGAFGTVNAVRDLSNDKTFAIKKINFAGTNDEIKRLLREVETLSKCSNEFVAQYYNSWIENDTCESDQCLYIQMELCSDNLKSLLERKRKYFKREKLQVMSAAEYFISSQIFTELLQCVQFLHELNPPIIHRDLKPENIIINEFPKGGRFLKICDFGIAIFDSLSGTSVYDEITQKIRSHTKGMGTLKYMAPEVNSGSYDTKVDIYSLAVIMMELFDFDINNEKNTETNLHGKFTELKETILAMMNTKYAERPQCKDLLETMNHWSINAQEIEMFEVDPSMFLREADDIFFTTYFKTTMKLSTTTKYSDLMKKFQIFSKINENLKTEIKLLHVYEDEGGKNILFATKNNEVYGIGENTFGTCGLGHNLKVTEPTAIPELQGKFIKNFTNGSDFVLAFDNKNEIFAWGKNDCGQLAREDANETTGYFKPQYICLSYRNFIKVVCGKNHSLALTSDGNIYGWGSNKYGQIGCGKDKGEKIVQPIKLEVYTNSTLVHFTNIYCSFNRSFALTEDGTVYSWGHNNWCNLGLDMDYVHGLDYVDDLYSIFEPTRVDSIDNIISVGLTGTNTYFLDSEGHIYFCGEYKRHDKITRQTYKAYKTVPSLLQSSEAKFSSLHFVPNFDKVKLEAFAIYEDFCFKLYHDKIIMVKCDSVIDFYIDKCKITHRSLKRIGNYLYEDSEIYPCNRIKTEVNKFRNEFASFKTFEPGGFGTVMAVKENSSDEDYAIKRIEFNRMSEINREDLLREVNILEKIQSKYVVKYFTAWIESNNRLYIQMELCSYDLKKIIKEKSKIFGRHPADEMNEIEFFISCQLFKELLECVQYLHELEPPIIHCDLKPANILLNETPIGERFMKLCDFGSAKIQKLTKKTRTVGTGSINYMAPEVTMGNNYNSKADIYSLGIIALQIFDIDINEPHKKSRTKFVDKWQKLDEIINSMLKPKANARPDSSKILSYIDQWSIYGDQLTVTDLNSTYSGNETYNFFKTYLHITVASSKKPESCLNKLFSLENILYAVGALAIVSIVVYIKKRST